MTTTPPEQLLTDDEIDDMLGESSRGFDIEREHYFKAVRDAQRALLAKLREQQPVCDLAAGWIAGRAETYAEVYSSNTLAEAYQAGAEFALRSKVLHAAAPAPTPAPVGAQEREHVDCIGLALDLEARAKTVESQTTERAMRAAAHGLRLLAARSAAQAAQAVPAGWKLMPVEPNTEMLDAVSSCHEGRLYPQDFVHGPRAMRRQEYATWLAAAPTPTGAGDEGGA